VNFLFLLARRTPDVPSQIILDVSRILRGRGHQVTPCIPEEELGALHDLPGDYDLCLLKSYTELSLSLVGALSAGGANLINPYEGCAAARNKIVCYQVLRKAEIKVPRAWITGEPALLKALARQCPLIVKPYMGWRGEGIRVVRNEGDAASLPPFSSPALIQEYIEHSGEDLRVYVAGEEMFGIRKTFSSSSFAKDGDPVAVSSEVRDIALRCGRAFGLNLYGIDIVEGADGPYVIDVNYFPGYKGVLGAAGVVADCVESHARRRTEKTQPARPLSEVAR
jgi:ribosomal protein S6--L-glutamate ligase